MEEAKILTGTGRRKTSVVTVTLKPGQGKITVNDTAFEKYFNRLVHRLTVQKPLAAADSLDKFDVQALACGGGKTGQADAMKLGIAIALLKSNPALRSSFSKAKLLTRDPRMVERKKYGLRKARRAAQYSKR